MDDKNENTFVANYILKEQQKSYFATLSPPFIGLYVIPIVYTYLMSILFSENVHYNYAASRGKN